MGMFVDVYLRAQFYVNVYECVPRHLAIHELLNASAMNSKAVAGTSRQPPETSVLSWLSSRPLSLQDVKGTSERYEPSLELEPRLLCGHSPRDRPLHHGHCTAKNGQKTNT